MVPGFEFDHHLIRLFPTWPALTEFFEVIDDTLGIYNLSAPPAGHDITAVAFRPHFEGAPSAHGVTVDTGAGAISLTAAPAPTPTLHNFMLEVEVSHTSALAPSPAVNGLRIHVHDNITGLKLTPNPLVGREGAKGVRFTVMGEFSDGVMGDITDWTVFRVPDPVTGLLIRLVQLHSSDSDIQIEPNRQTIDFLATGATATITADFRGSPTPVSVTAECDAPWSTPTEATFVAGPGEGARDDVPNILFLPDGFDAFEQTTFENLVHDIVTNGLARNSFLAPYNRLGSSINYWSCFVASPQRGVTVLSEVGRLHGSGTSRRGVPITRPSKPAPPPAANPWTLEELIHEVGLPVPAQAGLDLPTLLGQWQTVYGSHVTEPKVRGKHKTIGGATIEVWDFWRSLADRVLVNEVSTAFGVAVGGRHSADCVGTLARILVTNPNRLDKQDLDAFLTNLRFPDPASGGALVTFGDRWVVGRDVGLVCLIARTPHHAGANVGFLYTSSLGEEREHRLTTVGGGINVDPAPVSASAPTNVVTTVAHESSHSFSCGDEYAGDCSHGRPPATTVLKGNVQLADENALFVAAPPTIDATKIKWLWPRIDKAGVLRGVTRPDPAHPEMLTLQLRPGHSAFAVDDVVRLRARPLVLAPPASDRLKVKTVAVDAALGDTLTAEQIEGLPTVINLGDFPVVSTDSSILIRPVVPPGPALGNDILLVHPDIVAHLASKDGPLNAPLGAPTRDCATDFASHADPTRNPHLHRVQMATNLPPSLRHGTRTRPVWGSWIVGLYEGGAGFPCGIFHPTGACLMRAFTVPAKSLAGTPIVAGFDSEGRLIPPPGTLYHFCPVCRYILVDAIDPTKHPVMEAEYARIFPA
jgi:hypothetical protein